MAAMDVLADDVGGGIVDPTVTLYGHPQYVTQRPAGSNASAVAVAPVKNFVLVKNNRLPLAVRLNVGNERIKLLALHQGEHICERMKFKLAHARPRVGRTKVALAQGGTAVFE